MSINVSRDFVTELLKDLVYPEVCPICGDIIPTARRIAYHRALSQAAKPRSPVMHPVMAASHISCYRYQHLNESYQTPQEAPSKPDRPNKLYIQDLSEYYRGLVCDSCLNLLDFISPPYCRKCGKPLAYGSNNIIRTASVNESAAKRKETGQSLLIKNATAQVNSMLCSDCRAHERSFTQCRVLLSYDERMRDIMADIKYNGKKEYLKLFGVLAADRLGTWIKEQGVNCLIPVPVHASRLQKRGYNQSELLCRYISHLTHIPVRDDIIIRNKKTAAQKELNADERLLNLQSAFKTVGRLPIGNIALIVDDIYTTGSTMEACTERIREAGAGKVYGLTICIGEDKDCGSK